MKQSPHLVATSLVAASLLALFVASRERSAAAEPTAQPERPTKSSPQHDEAAHAARVPLAVQLHDGGFTPGPDGKPGTHTVEVILTVKSPLSFPLTMHAKVPRNATLAEGQHTEQNIGATEPGRIRRTFKISTAAPLSVDNPFRIVVDGESDDHVMGLHADRPFPQAAEQLVPPSAAPKAPAGRPLGPIAKPRSAP